jgi:hypothetical protein
MICPPAHCPLGLQAWRRCLASLGFSNPQSFSFFSRFHDVPPRFRQKFHHSLPLTLNIRPECGRCDGSDSPGIGRTGPPIQASRQAVDVGPPRPQVSQPPGGPTRVMVISKPLGSVPVTQPPASPCSPAYPTPGTACLLRFLVSVTSEEMRRGSALLAASPIWRYTT